MPTWRLPVNFSYADGGGPGVNVWHIRATGATPVETNLQSMVDAIHTFYDSITNGGVSGADCFQRGTVFTAGQAVDVDSDEATDVDWATLTVPNVGADAPPVLALCLTWRTSIAARRGRGRTFLGPLSQNALQDNGTPDEDFRSVVGNAADALISTSTGFNNGAVGIYGRESVGSSTHVIRDIVGRTVPNEFAVLRSRRD